MFTGYTTKQGDRWDTIAFDAYGNHSMFSVIQSSNPNLPTYDVFPGGISLLIPIIEIENTKTNDFLPPWKRKSDNIISKQKTSIDEQSKSVITDTAGSFDGSFD